MRYLQSKFQNVSHRKGLVFLTMGFLIVFCALSVLAATVFNVTNSSDTSILFIDDTGSGVVGIRTTSPDVNSGLTLGAINTTTEGGDLRFEGAGGQVAYVIDNFNDSSAQDFRVHESGSVRAFLQLGANGWQTPSDARLKENVTTYSGILNKLGQFRAVKYDLINGGKGQVGVIAQELRDIFPEVVSGSEDTEYGVNYGVLGAIALQAIKEQQEQTILPHFWVSNFNRIVNRSPEQ